MASRQQIKETFLTDLERAVSAYVPAENVVHDDTEINATEPMVTYRDLPATPITLGGASKPQPHRVIKNDDGEIIDEVYPSWYRLPIEVTAHAPTEGAVEPIYNAIAHMMDPYMMWGDSADFHVDVEEIEINDFGGADNTETERTLRGDSVRINVTYMDETRRYGSRDMTGDPIRAVNHQMGFNKEYGVSEYGVVAYGGTGGSTTYRTE